VISPLHPERPQLSLNPLGQDEHAICPIFTLVSDIQKIVSARISGSKSVTTAPPALQPTFATVPPQTLRVTLPPDMSPPVPSQFSQPSKPQRVLACVRCQHRKVKCDRCFPCSNCKASNAQCVPATLTPRGRRKRRFPERELLERLRKYEDLLRQNNINFEPLHKDAAGKMGSPNAHRENESDDEHPGALGADPPSPAITVKSERVYEAK
jgi:hypothetical protein